LESAAVRSSIPTRVLSELPEGSVLPQEIERNAYFIASEALVNATKHSGATDIQVLVSMHIDDRSWLDVSVTDNGVGGAAVVVGHGIAGLEERLRGLGGALEVLSPEGGPTIVTAHLPITTAAVSSVGS
jgi:signal transduction histidine kinase